MAGINILLKDILRPVIFNICLLQNVLDLPFLDNMDF